MGDHEKPEPEPYALTEEHVAGLERAIRAEGYTILVNTETGEVTLKRRTEGPAARSS